MSVSEKVDELLEHAKADALGRVDAEFEVKVLRMVLKYVQLAVDDAPPWDPSGNIEPRAIGEAFATINHIRRLLRDHVPPAKP
jgi:hypothetical protein